MLWSLLFISLIGSAHIQRIRASCNTWNPHLLWTILQSSECKDDQNVASEMRRPHTMDLQNSSWRIDLLDVYSISCVRIYNNQQLNPNISDIQIHIGNSRTDNGTANRMCTKIPNYDKTRNHFRCDGTVSGRYVTVFHPEKKPLILCEVKIYGKAKESPFVLINESKTWEDALDYCRDRHMGMASILNEETQTWAELEAGKATTPFVWLGLRYTCTLEFWFWVDDRRVDFSRWAPETEADDCDMSGAMQNTEEHLWFRKSDDEKFHFICAK